VLKSKNNILLIVIPAQAGIYIIEAEGDPIMTLLNITPTLIILLIFLASVALIVIGFIKKTVKLRRIGYVLGGIFVFCIAYLAILLSSM
jgi:hypothetical protein